MLALLATDRLARQRGTPIRANYEPRRDLVHLAAPGVRKRGGRSQPHVRHSDARRDLRSRIGRGGEQRRLRIGVVEGERRVVLGGQRHQVLHAVPHEQLRQLVSARVAQKVVDPQQARLLYPPRREPLAPHPILELGLALQDQDPPAQRGHASRERRPTNSPCNGHDVVPRRGHGVPRLQHPPRQ